MELCNSLRETRQERRLTQESLAQRVGITRQSIIAIEQAKFSPSVKLALELAHALDIPIQKLFWLEKPKGGKK